MHKYCIIVHVYMYMYTCTCTRSYKISDYQHFGSTRRSTQLAAQQKKTAHRTGSIIKPRPQGVTLILTCFDYHMFCFTYLSTPMCKSLHYYYF